MTNPVKANRAMDEFRFELDEGFPSTGEAAYGVVELFGISLTFPLKQPATNLLMTDD